MATLSDQHIADVMQHYVDAISAGDLEAVIALYADDAIVEDPVGTEPRQGHQALREFYQLACDSVARMELEGAVRVRAHWGACAMRAYPKGAEHSMFMETLDVMEFNDDGKITAMTAYWGDSNLRSL